VRDARWERLGELRVRVRYAKHFHEERQLRCWQYQIGIKHFFPLSSTQQHTIAVTVKTVPAFDRVAVRMQHVVPAGEGAYQRQQCGAR
jgi:hypothetical protein